MEELNRTVAKMGYEAPIMSVIEMIIGDVILQGSLDSAELEDTEVIEGSW